VLDAPARAHVGRVSRRGRSIWARLGRHGQGLRIDWSDKVERSIDTRRPAGLRILLAHDLSRQSEHAAALVAQAAWPAGTSVRVVTSSAGIGPALSSFASLVDARAATAENKARIMDVHEPLAADLREAGLRVETRTVHGKPERAIAAEADRFGADLIVVGARGQGSVAATVLGSVSRAVVEQATCSVLVARGPRLQRVLLATDGSRPASFASDLIASWPAFDDADVLLVAVGEPAPRFPRAVFGRGEWRSAFLDTIDRSTEQACAVAERAADDLGARGRKVEIEIRLGHVATEIIEAAQEWPADLVALGSNGRPLLERLLFGSDVRRVVDGVEASVLVARPPVEATADAD
jgi:nucleotide-binding universal stress UspA family protein